MKRLVSPVGLVVALVVPLPSVGCGAREVIQANQVAISDPPPIVTGSISRLAPPRSCPIYAAGQGEDDPQREPPFEGSVNAVCAVDDTGTAYGLIPGDIGPGGLPILPGNHELGVYIGFDLGPGDNPTIAAWAAPTNIESQDCCADTHPDKRIPVTLVASGEHGILFSVGSFDGTPIQVAYTVEAPAAFDYERFYVNGPP